MSVPEPIPLFVLTGFLGSGKTTILQRLLRSSGEVETGILINEFGEAGLDHRILAHVAEARTVIQNGCLCCSVRPELTRGLLDLVRRSMGELPRFRRLVLETSGLSDPAPIINTVQTHRVLKEYFRVAGVVTTVDAVNAAASFDGQPEFAKQIAVADTILVTKTDLTRRQDLQPLEARLRAANPLAEIRDARDPDLDLSGVFRERARALRRPTLAAEGEAAARHDVTTFSIRFEEEIDWSAFVTWLSLLLHRHGREVLRFKAMLNVAGEASPILVHGVQHIMHPPEHMPSWPDGDRRSQLVFIVRGLDPGVIRASLAAFLAFASGAIRPYSRPAELLAARER